MRRIALLAAGLSIVGQAALAADLRPPPPPPVKAAPPPVYFSWTGCYLGANVGYHWGSDKITTTTTGPVPADNAFIDSVTPTTLKPAGALGGVQGGCNYQASAFVIGIEADADWVGGTASRSLVFGPNAVGVNPADFITDATKATFPATV
jgi:outer membrane immunogenic protein